MSIVAIVFTACGSDQRASQSVASSTVPTNTDSDPGWHRLADLPASVSRTTWLGWTGQDVLVLGDGKVDEPTTALLEKSALIDVLSGQIREVPLPQFEYPLGNSSRPISAGGRVFVTANECDLVGGDGERFECSSQVLRPHLLMFDGESTEWSTIDVPSDAPAAVVRGASSNEVFVELLFDILETNDAPNARLARYDIASGAWTVSDEADWTDLVATCIFSSERVDVLNHTRLAAISDKVYDVDLELRSGPAASPEHSTTVRSSFPVAESNDVDVVCGSDRVYLVPRTDSGTAIPVAEYVPGEAAWHSLAESPAPAASGAFWTGTELVTLGHAGNAVYDPAVRAWRSLASGPDSSLGAWAGDSLVVVDREAPSEDQPYQASLYRLLLPEAPATSGAGTTAP